MLWRNSKECVVSENSCSKNFINFQEKHPREIAFLIKVLGYLTLTGNVPLGNLWNFQNSFYKKHPRMPVSAISCHWKMFRPKYIFQKISHSIFLIYVLIFNGMCSQGFSVEQMSEVGVLLYFKLLLLKLKQKNLFRLFFIYSKYISIYQGFWKSQDLF